jgi:BrnA antitoxin of type II toxin-antitoxin system
MPRRKETVTIRLDADLLEWFRSERGYQTRINAILRAYMNAHADDRSTVTMMETPAPSAAYKLFEQAMTTRKQILCTYNGHRRELCPVILGHSQGQEKALTYQFGGHSEKGLPPGGQWRCLFLSKVQNIRLRDGPWHAGDSHNQPQDCVEIVDLDVNPASPYKPGRRLKQA